MYSVSDEFLATLQSASQKSIVSVTSSDGTELSVKSGAVSMDSNREIGRTCTLDLMPSDTMTADDIYSLVSSPGVELTVKRGLKVPKLVATTSVTEEFNLVTNPSMETVTSGSAVMRRNLCLNPNFEATGTADWKANNASSTISRDTTTFYAGTASLKAVCAGTVAGEGAYKSLNTLSGFVAGQKFSGSMWVKAPAGTKMRLIVASSGTGAVSVNNFFTATGVWQYVQAQGATLGANLNPYISIVTDTSVAAQAVTFYVDSVMLEMGDTVGPYFDGSTSAALGWTYAWSGTANASISTAASAATTVRTNLVTNPSFEVDTTGWAAYLTTISRTTAEKYIGSASLQSVYTGVGSTYGDFAVTASQTYTASAWVKAPSGNAFRLDFNELTSAGAVVGVTQGTFTGTGAWQRVSVTRTFGATGVKARPEIVSTIAQTIYIDAVMVEASSVVGDYFDGSYSPAGDFSYAWSGTANASTSIQRGASPVLTTSWRSTTIQSTGWYSTGTRSIRLIPTSTTDNNSWTTFTVNTITGNTYTAKVKARLSTAQTGTLSTMARKMAALSIVGGNLSGLLGASSQPANTAGVTDLSFTFTATTATTGILLYNGGYAGAGDVWFDDLMVIEGTYTGNYFDGNSTNSPGIQYVWTGTADASTSKRVTTTSTTSTQIVDEYVPLGVFSTDEAQVSKSKTATVSWSGSDRSKKVARSRFLEPYQITAGTTLATAGTTLLQSRLSNVVCDFSNVNETIAAQIVFEAGANSDPWKSARQLFADFGYDLRFDGLGTVRAVPIPDPASQSATFDFGSGDTSLVLDGTAKASLEGVYNGVIATGEGTDVTAPVRAEVWDTDPTSPTYYLSGFGRVPYFFSSSLLTTVDAATRAAQTILARVKGRSQVLSWPAIVNPALEPLDIVSVTFGSKTSLSVIDSLSIPLTPNDAMSATARETSIT